MDRRTRAPLLLGAMILAAPTRPGPRADDGPTAEHALASKMAAGKAGLWSIHAAGDRTRLARPLPEPILRYSNPGVGRVYGDVVLFVEAGRPVAVFSIYK